MEQINIIFFIIGSFFTTENVQIGADKTTVTLYPETKQIEIIQEGLFTVIQPGNEKEIVLAQWEQLLNLEKGSTQWSDELKEFSDKKMIITSTNNEVKSHLILRYSEEKDLRVLGIWYDEAKNEFSINHIPEENIKTDEGRLEGNYWVFSAENNFSFNMEPFLQMPDNVQEMKVYLKDLLK